MNFMILIQVPKQNERKVLEKIEELKKLGSSCHVETR